MMLSDNRHLAYCTNIHRGESWAETLANLSQHTLAVREQVAPGLPYAIGLRLSGLAARELSDPPTLRAFRRWLDREECYVFTINGFPYGQFHGTRVKEQVYAPDWTTPERLAYTNSLVDLLAELLPDRMEGSISTLPASFKAFIRSEEQERALRINLWRCVDHIARVSERTGRSLHLGLEPEPLCYLETTDECVRFFEQMRAERPGDVRVDRHLGVNYDTCHLAVEFEEPAAALGRLRQHGIKLSKIHLSSALRARPSPAALQALRAYADDVYYHQVIVRDQGGLTRYRDLGEALGQRPVADERSGEEWRVHFHIPLHWEPAVTPGGEGPATDMASTREHLLGVLDAVAASPALCSHFEMETYTWEVLPPGAKNRSVIDQLAAEYAWTLGQLAARGIVRV